MKVGIIGAWHLGIVAATCLSTVHEVFVHDAEANNSLKNGIPVVDEPGVRGLLKNQLERTLHICSIEDAIKSKDVVIIAFDSPVNEQDAVDITPIMNAVDSIKKSGSNCLVVIMSQVPVGTCRKISEYLKTVVAYVPENLRLGQAISCFMRPDVLVIGCDDKTLSDRISNELFSCCNGKRAFMNLESAEMWKHSMNAYLAGMITLANSLADVCEYNNANISDVVNALKMDSRVSSKAPLGAGIGFGGGTLGRDVCVLQELCKKSGINSSLFDSISNYNRQRPFIVLKKLEKHGTISKMKVAVLGIAYKPGTNTLRRSTGLFLAGLLKEKGAVVSVFDPAIKDIPGFVSASSVADAVKDCDAVLLVTDWPEFKQIELAGLKGVMKHFLIVDCRNMLDSKKQAEAKNLGFVYEGMGIA